ncbi:hypothetical protein AAC387_Pa11g0536 [Persea americana]
MVYLHFQLYFMVFDQMVVIVEFLYILGFRVKGLFGSSIALLSVYLEQKRLELLRFFGVLSCDIWRKLRRFTAKMLPLEKRSRYYLFDVVTLLEKNHLFAVFVGINGEFMEIVSKKSENFEIPVSATLL